MAMHTSLDQFFRLKEHFTWDCEAKLLRSLEIDDQFELGRPFHRQVRWISALEDLINIGGTSAGQMQTIRAVRHEATCLHKSTPTVNRRQPSPGRELNDPCSIGLHER